MTKTDTDLLTPAEAKAFGRLLLVAMAFVIGGIFVLAGLGAAMLTTGLILTVIFIVMILSKVV